jgi:hypothetical protein
VAALQLSYPLRPKGFFTLRAALLFVMKVNADALSGSDEKLGSKSGVWTTLSNHICGNSQFSAFLSLFSVRLKQTGESDPYI